MSRALKVLDDIQIASPCRVIQVTKRTFERTRDELVVPEVPDHAIAGGIRIRMPEPVLDVQ